MRAAVVLAAFGLASGAALAGCAGSGSHVQQTDANYGGDAAQSCSAVLSYDPVNPIADAFSQIRVQAQALGAPGVVAYDWHVFDPNNAAVTFTSQAADGSQIGFIAPIAGPYTVSVDITGPEFCPTSTISIPVAAPGAKLADYRLRVIPPSGLAPPQETVIQVLGGGDTPHSIGLDAGLLTSGQVKAGLVGIPAYLRFMPVGEPDAYVEAFSANDGSYNVRLLGQMHDVLVVPAVAGLAPALVTWTVATTTLPVGPGTAVSGTVKDAANAALVGAKVQLSSGGVPSTIATTDSSGNFTVRASFAVGSTVTVEIAPPPGRGLPRLSATAVFDLSQSMQIKYASQTTCDLVGTAVQRAGSNLPGVMVTLVGQLAAIAGTVTAGASANATGTIRIAASADATGKLPSTIAPRVALSTVVEVSASDLAVGAVDLTGGCAAQTIAAPAMTAAVGTTATASGAIGNIALEATPTDAGALALAGALPVLGTSAIDGAFSLALATGGFYDVRFFDPAGIAAPLVVLDVGAAGVPTSAVLPAAVHISGTLTVSGSSNPIEGASVQILCVGCTGLDAARPIAQTATDITSKFRLAVPDPGTM